MQQQRRVVVTGIGLICAVGNTRDEVWKNLCAGKSGVDRITHFDTTGFACTIAAEVKGFDPLQFIEKKELVYILAKSNVSREEFRFEYTITYFVASQFFNLGLRMDLFLLSYFFVHP